MEAFLSDSRDTVLVVLEDGEAEVFTVEEFISFYGEDALPVCERDNREVVLNPKCYWNAALSLINAWANYQAKKKLYINATNPDTYFKVKKVIDDKYGGSTGKLRDHRNKLSKEVDKELDFFEDICLGYDVEPVTRDWLFHFLEDYKDYQKLRAKCKKRLKKPAESLKNL